MTREAAIRIFTANNPDIFEKPWVREMPPEETMAELILDLKADSPLPCPTPEGVTFGVYQGSLAQLRQAEGAINPRWIPYFEEAERVFCAYGWDGLILGCCILQDMGEHEVQGKRLRIAGPGCVGVLPTFRRQGVGLAMVREATLALRQDGYDLSWIHYTGLAHWYGKLGYRTVLTWNGQKGFLED